MKSTPLTDLEYLRSRLARANASPQRALGQNFLTCAEVVEASWLALQSGPGRITELGAGAGAVTQRLLHEGCTVRAIERDKTLVEVLRREHASFVKQRQLEIITADLRDTPWEWQEPYQLVGNIPYNLSGLILRRLTQLTPAPEQVVLLVQKEVGQRLVAQPPHMELLAVAVQLWATVHPLLTVPASCFWPQPEVDSLLVLLVPHTEAQASASEREQIVRTAKYFFQTKRKQMGGRLRAWRPELSRSQAEALLQAVDIPPTARPQTVTLPQWQALTRALA